MDVKALLAGFVAGTVLEDEGGPPRQGAGTVVFFVAFNGTLPKKAKKHCIEAVFIFLYQSGRNAPKCNES